MKKITFRKVNYKKKNLTRLDVERVVSNRENFPDCCPFCGADDYTGGQGYYDCNVNDKDVTVTTRCVHCHARWEDTFDWAHIMIFHEGAK